jgi:hypothetical protein
VWLGNEPKKTGEFVNKNAKCEPEYIGVEEDGKY